MYQRIALYILIATVAAIPASRPAHAQDKRLARLHFVQGKRHFLARQYTQAVRAFERAYRYRKHRVILFNIALAHARRGDPVAAATHLRQYLKRAQPGDRALPDELHRVLRCVGVLSIKVTNPRAQIYIDGRFVGLGRADLVVKPGRSAVVVKLGLKILARKTLRITAGKEHLWEVPNHEASTGGVPTSSGDTPPNRGWRRFGRLHWAYFAAAAGATAGLVIGAVATSVRAKAIHDDYALDPTNTSLRDQGLRTQRITNALWGFTVASAVGTAAVAFFTRWKGRERARRFSARPTFGPGQAGLSLSWNY